MELDIVGLVESKNRFTAVLDACVLYPAPLRDLLLRLALAGLYRAKWTDQIQAEWVTALLRNEPSRSPEALDRTRQRMDASVRDCKVVGYEELISGLTLPDPDDRHVLAAAIRCDADMIITANLNDFPADVLATYDIEAQHPDRFLVHQWGLDEALVLKVLKEQRTGLRRSTPKSLDFLAGLERNGLTMFVEQVRRYADLI